MNDITFNNGEKISKNNSVEKIISEIIEKHPRVPKILGYVKHIDFNMDSVNYLLEKGSKKDFNLFLAAITENSDFITFKEFEHLSHSIPQTLKSKFYSYIENIVFNNPFSPEDIRTVTEERYRHKLIFEMANYTDNSSLIEKWYNMEDFYTKTGNAQTKYFSIKSILFWELQAYKNDKFYNALLESRPTLLAAANSNIDYCVSHPEDILFSHYTFEDKHESVKIFKDFEVLKEKSKKKAGGRKMLSTCIEQNKNLSAKNLQEVVSFYKQKLDKNEQSLLYKNIYRTALSAFVRNRGNNAALDNEFFNSYFSVMENDIGLLSSSDLSTMLSICILNIENKKTIDFIQEKIRENREKNPDSDDYLSLKKIESYYKGYRFNVNLENKPTQEDIYNVLTVLHENRFNMSKIFSLSIFDDQTKPSQHKEASVYIKHYFPVFIDFFVKNNLTLSKKEAEKIVQYFTKDSRVEKFLINKIKESLIEVIKNSNLNVENMLYLFKKTELKNIPEFKLIIAEKEKQALLTTVSTQSTKIQKKRI